MMILYRLAWLCVWPLLPLFWVLRVFKGKEKASRLPERLGFSLVPNAWRKSLCTSSVLHIHGASVGECKSLEPLIHQLLKDNTHCRIVWTSGTQTSAKVVAHLLKTNGWHKRVQHRLLPWDVWPCVWLFYRKWQPELSLFVESELWPEMLRQAQKCPQKPLLINARLSEKSFKTYQKYPKLAQLLYGAFGHIFARSTLDATRLEALGFTPKETGDMKYDALALPYDAKKMAHYAALTKGKKVVVAASTHAEEEGLIVAAAKLLPNTCFILVPRHPERGPEMSQHYQAPARSQGAVFSGHENRYIADTLGELGLWYALAAHTQGVVLMGGSFSAKVQGHNPLEPVKLGARTLCGPHMGNFMDMVHDLGDALQHTDALDAETMAKNMQKMWNEPQKDASHHAYAKNVPNGTTDAIAKHVKILLG